MSGKKIIGLSLVLLGVGIIVAFLVISYISTHQPTAGLKISSTPQSDVYVNNTLVGTTPIDKMYPPGEIAIKVVPRSEKIGMSTYQTKVLLTAHTYTVIRRDFGVTEDKTSSETISMLAQPEKTPSLAIVSTSPEFASVNLDGQPQGFTPLYISSVYSGDHQIIVSAPGYTSRTISVVAIPNYKLAINTKLATDTSTAFPSPTPQLDLTTSATPSASPVPTITGPHVTILTTPTGFLRVRSGPGSTYPEIGQTKPGEVLTLLESIPGWYLVNVKLTATSSGWISSQYAKKSP